VPYWYHAELLRKWSLVQTLPITIFLQCLFSTIIAGTYIGGQGLPAYCRSCEGTWHVVSNDVCFLIACIRLRPFASVLIFGCILTDSRTHLTCPPSCWRPYLRAPCLPREGTALRVRLMRTCYNTQSSVLPPPTCPPPCWRHFLKV
jgi:hypothetical protein